ncbi:hypothetical protein L596_001304 [Steinernema carpocapsae]|uniref:Uncharacterized protein n=1 Tax=Steinernema carpocapsae TaxID=34508 RepID=A0A4U8UKM9_STECR|nr:hypothetical protein L596_001304 [Steinernema carpocapsae]
MTSTQNPPPKYSNRVVKTNDAILESSYVRSLLAIARDRSRSLLIARVRIAFHQGFASPRDRMRHFVWRIAILDRNRSISRGQEP